MSARSIIGAIACLTLSAGIATAQGGSGITFGTKGSVPLCTHATLQAGTCQVAAEGYLATISDGLTSDADRCATSGTGGGSDTVTCRYDGAGWLEHGEAAAGARYDLEINIAQDPCATFNAAIAPYMDGTKTAGVVRVHHDRVEEITITALTDFVDHGPYKSCFVLHPSTDTTTYPDPFAVTAATNLSNITHITVVFDGLNIDVEQTGLDENAMLFDVGNGWGAGAAYGSLGSGFQIRGEANVRIGVSGKAEVGVDKRVIPSASSAHPFNATYPAGALALWHMYRATYTDAGRMTVRTYNPDKNDIACVFASTWGSKLPTCETFGFGEGIGIQFRGPINADYRNTNLRSLTYGIVLGDPVNRGYNVHYSSCASSIDGDGGTNCADEVVGAGGLTFSGGVVEGHTHAMLVDYGGIGSNVWNDIHWECGNDACALGGILLKPYACDGSGANALPAGIPATTDDAVGCTDGTVNVSSIVNEVGFVTINTGSAHGLSPGDTFAIRDTGSDYFDDSLFLAGTGTTGSVVVIEGYDPNVTVGAVGTLTVTATSSSAAVPHGPTPTTLHTFAGRISPSGPTRGAPAIVLGEDYTDAAHVLFENGIRMGNQEGSDLSTPTTLGDLVALHPALTRETQADPLRTLAGAVGAFETSGATFSGGTNLPLTYDGWIDDREEIFVNVLIKSGAHNGSGLPSDKCLDPDDPDNLGGAIWVDSSGCSEWPNNLYGAGPTVIHWTRALAHTVNTWNADESCEVGVSMDFGNEATQGDYEAVFQIPPIDGLAMATGRSWVYPIGLTSSNAGNSTPSFHLEIGDGENCAGASCGTLACTGNFGTRLIIRGFRFDPTR